MFANATLSQGLFLSDALDSNAKRLLTPLNQILKEQEWMVGNIFNVVDVAIGSTLPYIPIALDLDLSPFSGLLVYIKRLTECPAFMKSIGH